jgi:hypothetical protein
MRARDSFSNRRSTMESLCGAPSQTQRASPVARRIRFRVRSSVLRTFSRSLLGRQGVTCLVDVDIVNRSTPWDRWVRRCRSSPSSFPAVLLHARPPQTTHTLFARIAFDFARRRDRVQLSATGAQMHPVAPLAGGTVMELVRASVRARERLGYRQRVRRTVVFSFGHSHSLFCLS